MSITGSSIADYAMATRDLQKRVDRLADSGQEKRDIDWFKANAPKIDSVEALLKDRKTLKVVLSAYGLEDSIDQKALIRKVITDDPSDPKALSNRLNDPRYKLLAKDLHGLATDGGAAFRSPAYQDQVLAGYRTESYEVDQGSQNPAVREAMYFARKASQVTTTFQILSDKTMADVVRTALGLPSATGALDVDQQKRAIEKKLDVAKFQDPKFVEKFTRQYLAMADLQNPPSQGADAGVVSLFSGAGDAGDGSAAPGLDLVV